MRGAIQKRCPPLLPPLFSFWVAIYPGWYRMPPILTTACHRESRAWRRTWYATSVRVPSVLGCPRRCLTTASSSSPPPSSSSTSSSSSSSRPYRIVIPHFSSRASSSSNSSRPSSPSSSFVASASRADPFAPPPYTPPSSFTPHLHHEYAEARSPPPLSQLASLLPPDVADVHRRHVQASHEDWQHETLLERVWDGNHPHLRKQAQLVEGCGGDAVAAAEELVRPTRPSFREELGRRPMDKGILEEIYMNLHGKRIERKLKKGVSWEHWISKGEGTAPVFTASRKAQQAFGMGGHVRWWASAREASQFPIMRAAKEAHYSKKKEKRKKGSPSSPLQKNKINSVEEEENAGGTEATRREETEANTEEEEEENGLLLGCVSHRSHRPLPPLLHHRRHPTAAAASSSSSYSSSSTSLLLPPEFAFIGRTSSGKSSLLNAIVNAAVAPYGHLQGTTTAVNFYRVGGGSGGGGGAFTLVDCPGYGFFNPIQTPEVEAANAVKVMKDYLYQGGMWEPRRRLRSMDGMGRASSGIQKRAPPPPKSKRKKKKKGGQEESGGTPSTFFYPGVEDMPAAHGETGNARRRGRNDDEAEEEEDKGVGERRPGSVHHRRLRPLQRVFVCASSRGLQHLDWRYCDLLESIGVPFTVVLTKTDAAPIRFLARLTDYTRCRLVQYKCCKELMLTSALRLSGVDKMQNLIASMLPSLDGRRAGRRGEDDGMDFSSLV